MSYTQEKNISKLITNKVYRTETSESFNSIDEIKFINKTPYTKKGYFKLKDVSSSEEDFVKNYGNLLSSVSVNETKMFIEESDNKISIKIKNYESFRKLSSKFFVTRRKTVFLTFNHKTKLFYFGQIFSKKKKVTKKTLLVNPLFSNVYYFFSKFCEEMKIEWNTYFSNFIEKIWKELELKNKTKFPLKGIPLLDYTLTYYLVNDIKIPNQWEKFPKTQFLKKELRKNNLNIVDTVMSKINVKGNKVRKLINEVKNLNFSKLNYLYHLLGIDKFNKLPDKIFDDECDYWRLSVSDDDGTYQIKEWECFQPNWYYSNYITKLTEKEKDRIVNYLKEKESFDINLFSEHIGFKKELKKLGEEVKIKFETDTEFVNEDEEWSRLLQSYKTGNIERFYGNIEELSSPITHKDEIYYPVLLTKTEDFEKESQHQHNCVRTYSEKSHCIVFSIRKGSVDGDERMTVEYQFRRNQLVNVQERIRFNNFPSEEFSFVGRELLVKANFLYTLNVLKLPKLTKRFPNGKVIERQATFETKYNESNPDEKVFHITPVWDEPFTENNHWYDLLPEPVERYETFDDLLP